MRSKDAIWLGLSPLLTFLLGIAYVVSRGGAGIGRGLEERARLARAVRNNRRRERSWPAMRCFQTNPARLATAIREDYCSLPIGRRLLISLVTFAMVVPLSATASGTDSTDSPHLLAYFPSASNPLWEGFARIVTHSNESGAVEIVCIDDAGGEYGPIELTPERHATVNFNLKDNQISDKGPLVLNPGFDSIFDYIDATGNPLNERSRSTYAPALFAKCGCIDW